MPADSQFGSPGSGSRQQRGNRRKRDTETERQKERQRERDTETATLAAEWTKQQTQHYATSHQHDYTAVIDQPARHRQQLCDQTKRWAMFFSHPFLCSVDSFLSSPELADSVVSGQHFTTPFKTTRSNQCEFDTNCSPQKRGCPQTFRLVTQQHC